jgi:hypothetical protein
VGWFVVLTISRVLSRDNLPRLCVLVQQRKSILQDLSLQLTHARPAQTIANLETFRIERARWPHLRRNFRTYRNQDRWYSLHLNLSLNRNDRAVANIWSTTGQNHRVSSRPLINFIGNLAGGAFVHRLELHCIAHVADVLFGNCFDKPPGLKVS